MDKNKIRRELIKILHNTYVDGKTLSRDGVKPELKATDNELDLAVEFLIGEGFVTAKKRLDGQYYTIKLTHEGVKLAENTRELNDRFPILEDFGVLAEQKSEEKIVEEECVEKRSWFEKFIEKLDKIRISTEYVKEIFTNLSHTSKNILIILGCLVFLSIFILGMLGVKTDFLKNAFLEAKEVINPSKSVRLEQDNIKINEPQIAFSSAPCMPIPHDDCCGNSILNSYFTINNLGNASLPYEFEISSDFAKFRLINRSCHVDPLPPCCLEFYNNCTYKARHGFQRVILPGKSKRFEYEILVPSVEESFEYSIVVSDFYHNESLEIVNCKYEYGTFENFDMSDKKGYVPLAI